MAQGSAGELEIKIEDRDGMRIMHLRGEHTVYNARILKTAVEEAIKKGVVNIIVDLLECLYVDSAGLGTLVSCRFRVTKAGGTFAVCNAAQEVLRVFKLARIDKIVPVFDSVNNAIAGSAGNSNQPPPTEDTPKPQP